MKKHILEYRWFLVILSGLCTSSMSVAQKSPEDTFTFPELNKIVMPEVQQEELKNGMKIFLIQDKEFPTVDFRAMVKVGSIYEPGEKAGLASLTGDVLRTGGTEAMTGEQIDSLFELLGGSVETGIGQEWGHVSISVFKQDMEKGFRILADLLRRPAFRTETIQLAKIRQRSLISRRNDEVWTIMNREFGELIYGAESPYVRHPEYATVDAITREDLVSFYRKFFHPNNTILAVWGDVDPVRMKEEISMAFSSWESSPIVFPEVQLVEPQHTYTISHIHKPELNQSHIQIGHIGGMMNSPDYPALVIMTQILNRDRIFNTIRSTEGLTYAPWGFYDADYNHPGVFSCGTQTKSQSTVYAIRLILGEVKRITQEEVTQEELQRAKDSYLNRYVFNFDSKGKIVGRMMTYAFYDYPLDFAEQTKKAIESVTRKDVLRVAHKHLRPDKVQILVAGNQEDFDEPLSVLGKVNTIDISIPGTAQ